MERKELKLEVGKKYVVTKASTDGTFEPGDHIALIADGCINFWRLHGWVAAADVPSATEGMEVELDKAWLALKHRVDLAKHTAELAELQAWSVTSKAIKGETWTQIK